MGKVIPVREYQTVPADVYLAKCTGYEEKETDYGPSVKLNFEILTEAYHGVSVDGLASMPADGVGHKAKLYKWAKAIMGVEELSGIDLDALVGKVCRLTLVQVEGNTGGTFNRIESILPRPAARKPQPVPVKAKEQEEPIFDTDEI